MLDFKGNLVEKRIVLDIGSSKSIERDTVVTELDVALIDKLYY